MSSLSVNRSSEEIVRALQQQVRRIEGSGHRDVEPLVSSGCTVLDQLLPAGGFRHGTLVEWLSQLEGSGAGTLAAIAAREASRAGGAVVLMDRQRWFYPPAAAALGIDLENVIVVRATTDQDEIWALDQSLRCPGVAAVWASLGERIDQRHFRRWQLAAESGGSLGLLLRPATVRGRPSWSHVQLLVEPRAGQSGHGRVVRVQLTRCHGDTHRNIHSRATVDLEINDATGTIRQAQSRSSHHHTRSQQRSAKA